AELRDQVRQMSAALQKRGVSAGDGVLIFVPMSIDLYLLLLGVMHMGATVVFVDPGMGRPQIEAALALARPRAFAAIPKAHLLRLVSRELRRVPIKLTLGGKRLARLIADQPTDGLPTPVAADAPALLTFTSGSTGQPKGAMRSHRFLLTQHRALTDVLGTTPEDIEMPALPIFLLNTLAAGATAVIPPVGVRVADVDPAALAQTLISRRVTTTAGSPALYRPLLEWCRANQTTFPHLRRLFLGGAPVPPDLLRQLEALLPNGETVVVYGSTEAEPIAHMAGSEILEQTASDTAAGHGLCVGVPADSVRVRIQDDEILVAGDHVNQSYYKNEEAVRLHKIRDSDGTVWHRTGDAGRFDTAGRLWLLGRTDHVIQRGDRTIYPFSVELAARALPGVTQAALVEHDNRITLAWEGDGDEEALSRLDPAMERLVRVPKMPTDPRHNAKIDRVRLAALLG
ncbi:MAG: acyl-CoA synthetase (AMP-forming)/AMP-acid ligase II, partial [Myxococcota bacterium]